MFLAFDGLNVASMERATKDIKFIGWHLIRIGHVDSRAHDFFTSRDYEHWSLHPDEFQSLWVIIYFFKFTLVNISDRE